MVILMPSSKIHQNQLQQIHAHSHSMPCSLSRGSHFSQTLTLQDSRLVALCQIALGDTILE